MDVILGSLTNFLAPEAAQTFGIWTAAILTLLVYSYLLGDNPLYRLAQHLFVGTAVGYAALVAYHQVLWPRLFAPLSSEPYTQWPLYVPAALCLLLLTKVRPSLGWIGNVSIGLLLGVGAALGISGALLGSLLPQVKATFLSLLPSEVGLDLAINHLIIVVGTTGALLSFYFVRGGADPVARLRRGLVQVWGGFGRWMILVAFGAIFAQAFMARVAQLIGRVQFLLFEWLKL